MFLKFKSQKERKKYGGSCFIELQICRLSPGTRIEDILDEISFWQDDSLYVDDDKQALFYEKYKDIFGSGIYTDLSEGFFDTWGVTYYPPDRIKVIAGYLTEHKPEGFEILSEWLKEAEQYNGFYILGV